MTRFFSLPWWASSNTWAIWLIGIFYLFTLVLGGRDLAVPVGAAPAVSAGEEAIEEV